jgi:hypothetical protein
MMRLYDQCEHCGWLVLLLPSDASSIKLASMPWTGAALVFASLSGFSN